MKQYYYLKKQKRVYFVTYPVCCTAEPRLLSCWLESPAGDELALPPMAPLTGGGGELMPKLKKPLLPVGVRVHSVGELFPSSGVIFPVVGEPLHSEGELLPSVGDVMAPSEPSVLTNESSPDRGYKKIYA